MRKQPRGPEPDFLATNWERLGLAWEALREAKRAEKKQASWDWGRIDGQPIYPGLMKLLRAQAGSHCSFCDAFPVSPPSNETIEHVRPKSQFPRDAWKWGNLFYCCDFCQTRKGSKWKPTLLAPDIEGYAFSNYFYPDYTSGRIEIRPGLSPEESESAKDTLEIYGLNDPRHWPMRLMALEFRSGLPHRSIDDFAYRDFLEPG
jgi:uncharacterized protein (TIGR02646 family)